MVSVFKLGGTINQTGGKGGKSKRSKYHRILFLFPLLCAPASRGSPLDRVLSTGLGKEKLTKISVADYTVYE